MADKVVAMKGGGATSMEEVVRDRTSISNPDSQNPASPGSNPDSSTDNLHGDWHVVTRHAGVGDFKDGSTGPVICTSSLSSGLAISASGQPKLWHRKRPRKDQAQESVIHHAKAPSSELSTNKGAGETSNRPKQDAGIKKLGPMKEEKTKMIGNIKFFDLGGGAKSTMDLVQVEGNKFKFRDGVEMEDHVAVDHADKSHLSQVEIIDHEDGHGLKDLSHVDRGPTEVPMLSE
ncbi:DNA topoisomerase IV subunit B [Sesbania bispinosa]|nr:DNA topoisomerase IV subunit B [Sesbania bispinosa]